MVTSDVASPLSDDQSTLLTQMDIILKQVEDLLENDTPRALSLVEYIITQTEPIKHDEFQRRRAFALRLLSRLAYRHMKFSDAVAHALASMTIYEMLDDREGLHQVNFLLGIYHNRIGDSMHAMQYLIRAKEYAEQDEDYKGIGSASNTMAVIYMQATEYNRALALLDESISMKKKAGDIYGEAVVLHNLSRVYALMQAYDTAIAIVQHSIVLSRQIQSEYLRVSGEIVLGDVYASAGKYEEALSQFDQCLQDCREHQWLELEIATVSKVGEAYLGIAQVDRALDILTKGLSISQQHLSSYITTDILKVMVQAYEMQGNHALALETLKTLQTFQQEQIEAERRVNIQALESNYQQRIARQEESLQLQRLREVEERARKDREYFQQLNQMRDEFLHNTTHDLKNPLAVIQTQTYILKRKIGDDADLIEHIQQIDRQTNMMRELIANMLELAKLETGHALAFKPIALAKLLQEVVADYQHSAQYRLIQLQFDCAMPQDETMTYVDPPLIRRVFRNLVSNAIKFSNRESNVNVKLERKDNMLLVTVSDQGIGISEANLPYIFERFYRVRSTETASTEGTGLGLSIVKSIVEQHQGMISVQSTIGKGTSFHVTLPIRTEPRLI